MFNFMKKDTLSHEERMRIAEELIDTYGKGMTSFAYTYLKDWGEAEEVVQEVFIIVYKKIDGYKGISSIKTWLYSITANKCKDVLKSSYKKRSVITDKIQLFVKDTESSTEDEYYKNINAEQLAQSIMDLPIKYREIIILYYYNDLNTEEISRLLDMSNSTVRSRLRRGRNLLKAKLEGGNEYYGQV
ncbi:sigma-70 family RNA polymerase sigma factor [Lederbergia citri]|uniref:RNA polymerase sigma factor n=1 Tax=Lederbergia citri TaxID=2833580 RepID=A0A942TG94_9BACI|nr:sigma-70 family RNA polymerase sigma factor [Lederbergia citri]MBS4196231.1 sigma-70 family RNA polymerase sigma factor [Lederbergia citri]